MTFDPNVFVPSQSFLQEGYDIRTILGKETTVGEIGIEIECEGNKFPKGGPSGAVPKGWKYTHDGSLRGEDNAEYVLSKPVMFDDVPALVHNLYARLREFGTVLDESNRTSVHVHLNVQSWYLPRLTSFLGLYFCVEELLTEWCGDHRVGNLFCLRGKDAPGIVSRIKKFIVNDGRTELSEGLHYSGMNANALTKFGSLEIRSLRGVTDPDLLLQWVAVLERLYHLSEKYEDPRTVTENFSGADPLDFLRDILGPSYDVIRSGIAMEDTDVRSSMYDGIRLAQDLCYCRDWSEYKKADPSKNPFGRNAKSSTYGGLSAAFTAALNQAAYYDSALTTSTMPAPGPVENPEPFDFEPEPDYDEDY